MRKGGGVSLPLEIMTRIHLKRSCKGVYKVFLNSVCIGHVMSVLDSQTWFHDYSGDPDDESEVFASKEDATKDMVLLHRLFHSPEFQAGMDYVQRG